MNKEKNFKENYHHITLTIIHMLQQQQQKKFYLESFGLVSLN